MIRFENLYITPNGKDLIITVSVNPDLFYKNVGITAIVIDNQDTYDNRGPSSDPLIAIETDSDYAKVYAIPELCTNQVLTDDNLDVLVEDEGLTKRFSIRLNARALNVSSLEKNIFFVYVITNGHVDMMAPCSADYKMKTVFSLKPYYSQFMSYLKELSNDCSIPKGLIDLILRLNALEASLRTCHYEEAIKYWKTFFTKETTVQYTKNCGCHGRIV